MLNAVSPKIADMMNALLVGAIAMRGIQMEIKTLREEDEKPTIFIPCDTCGKGWPPDSMIYLNTGGIIAYLCCWACAREFAAKQMTEEI